MKTIYCGTYKTQRGAERYVTRQSTFSQHAHGEDISGNYTIQPTVIRKDYWTTGPKYFLKFKVYYQMAVAA